jgi:hypothetical protein
MHAGHDLVQTLVHVPHARYLPVPVHHVRLRTPRQVRIRSTRIQKGQILEGPGEITVIGLDGNFLTLMT